MNQQTKTVAAVANVVPTPAIAEAQAAVKVQEQTLAQATQELRGYLETVALAQAINAYAKEAALPPVMPELPVPLEFPAVTLAGYHLAKRIGVTRPEQMLDAHARLASRLEAMGIEVL